MTSNISFLSYAEDRTLKVYSLHCANPSLTSEIIIRLVPAILLSLAAALDLAFHGIFILPTSIYSVITSVYQQKVDFVLTWQHIERVRNAVAPFLLGSIMGLLHPLAGILICEATSKHVIIGMLSSNILRNLETPCSPIHSLSIVKEVAVKHRFAISNGVQREIFSAESIQILNDLKNFEWSLEILQAQEFIHKITNITFYVMLSIMTSIAQSNLSPLCKKLAVRLLAVLVPFLTAIDIVITFLVQGFFLLTGAVRLISDRGPLYTEVTTDPLMHLSFLIQSILKSVGNLLGTLVWFVDPITGFRLSLIPANLFFKLQINLFMKQIEHKLRSASEDSRFAIPIVLGLGESSAFSVPTHSMHKMYMIVEKKGGLFRLYWVNRPDVSRRSQLDIDETLTQIRSIIDERFPFMDLKKMMDYPFTGVFPEFSNSIDFLKIDQQGGMTNCVVSNMFGMLEALDRIRGADNEVTALRYKEVRKVLRDDYGFYKNDFFPFSTDSSVKSVWDKIEKSSDEPI